MKTKVNTAVIFALLLATAMCATGCKQGDLQCDKIKLQDSFASVGSYDEEDCEYVENRTLLREVMKEHQSKTFHNAGSLLISPKDVLGGRCVK